VAVDPAPPVARPVEDLGDAEVSATLGAPRVGGELDGGPLDEDQPGEIPWVPPLRYSTAQVAGDDGRNRVRETWLDQMS